jgi:hypothetical protein
VPQAALAAVILSAGIAIVDVAGFRRLYELSKLELAIAALGMLSVMILEVLDGALLAVGASVLLALGRIALPHDAILAHAKSLCADERPDGATPIEHGPQSETTIGRRPMKGRRGWCPAARSSAEPEPTLQPSQALASAFVSARFASFSMMGLASARFMGASWWKKRRPSAPTGSSSTRLRKVASTAGPPR